MGISTSIRADGRAYSAGMNTKVTTMSVLDSEQNIRELFVNTEEGGDRAVEYHLGTSLVVKQEDGTFKVSDTGEILTLLDARS